ncbi:hypothetical protein [Solicola gregarius]|uniref:Secreted protein n=1 Tax=Solicola gregarius TaxID=2908642 RepID=A0AA46YL92_9ACTN|nr:hypothetical protein [Solicola gregarius]UYM06675.1 hypothetical protein L0C25_06285 [Solicola gregarius]
MITRTMKLLGVAAFAAASTLSLGSAAGADVRSDGWDLVHSTDPTDGDAGGVSIWEWARAAKNDPIAVSATFEAYDEKLRIDDDFDNDRPTVVRLWVGRSGPAEFFSTGDGKTFDLSYNEGQTVRLQVCTSDTRNATCTKVKKYPGRT